jgi:hypothetical protein
LPLPQVTVQKCAPAAFTGTEPPFAEILLSSGSSAFTIRIEVQQMRLHYPGQIAIPLMLILAAGLFLMGRFDIIQVARFQAFWPVALIAAGLEELYLWATSEQDR